MPEEAQVASAEIVQPRFAVGGRQETVFRAAAVAGKAHLAASALRRQAVELGPAEARLLRRADQVGHVRLTDVAEPVLGLDEVIAGVEIAVVLERQRRAAGRRVHTQTMRLAGPGGE